MYRLLVPPHFALPQKELATVVTQSTSPYHFTGHLWKQPEKGYCIRVYFKDTAGVGLVITSL